MNTLDFKEAESRLKEVFLTPEIQKVLGITDNDVEDFVKEDCIRQVQKERIEGLPKMISLKDELQKKFPSFRFEARLKSLSSIFGKMLEQRTLADVFGFSIVVSTIEDCYYFKNWLLKEFEKFEVDDRIMNPKDNGYRDLQVVVRYDNILVEFIIQTREMYIDARTIQAHEKKYPWKYHDVVRALPPAYKKIKF